MRRFARWANPLPRHLPSVSRGSPEPGGRTRGYAVCHSQASEVRASMCARSGRPAGRAPGASGSGVVSIQARNHWLILLALLALALAAVVLPRAERAALAQPGG